jgi:hypothetical protein
MIEWDGESFFTRKKWLEEAEMIKDQLQAMIDQHKE